MSSYAGLKFSRWNDTIIVGSGLLSVAFGLFLSYQVGIAGDLFGANPLWVPR